MFSSCASLCLAWSCDFGGKEIGKLGWSAPAPTASWQPAARKSEAKFCTRNFRDKTPIFILWSDRPSHSQQSSDRVRRVPPSVAACDGPYYDAFSEYSQRIIISSRYPLRCSQGIQVWMRVKFQIRSGKGTKQVQRLKRLCMTQTVEVQLARRSKWSWDSIGQPTFASSCQGVCAMPINNT